ncbi:serine hydrolase domain-containing protein [Sinosporangium siamense]|uniref:Esterase n=1 Tax=Sinosporangium siamense TaxID=1367973 RepID=A0A919V888_9ACTN|nr:serine hydrolase domain-containing protein [Sinosporangium siamense]GII94203.1 esterase [Sinosporangium siamense]
MIRGEVAPGWQPVYDAFAKVMSRPGEIGAGLHIIHRGSTVVDLYGGSHGPDIRQVLFSASKGVASVCLAVLADRGELDVEAPVARYWPEFGRRGKSGITVAQMLSHQAGLIAPKRGATLTEVLEGRPLADALAAESPRWPSRPAGRPGYHAVTWGTLADELVRRVTGGRLGDVLHELVCRPQDLAISIGGGQAGRPPVPVRAAARIPLTVRMTTAVFARAGTPLWQAMTVGGALTEPPHVWMSLPETLAAHLPAANGLATAPALARMYALLLAGALVREGTWRTAVRPQTAGWDRVLGLPAAYGCGFALPSPAWRLGSPTAFGHPGIGGALGLGDPRRELALAFLPRTMPADALRDARHRVLLDAVTSVIGA